MVGLAHLKAFHLNDCKKPLGCRVDRHEHIGEGALGRDPFRRLVNDRRFAALPAFLETEMRFQENLDVLRSLLAMTREQVSHRKRAAARAHADPRPRVRLGGRLGREVRARLDRLVEFARGHHRALILTHDNPDPTRIAAGVALAWLLEQMAGVEAVVAYGGIVGRAENRALVKVLRLPVVPLSRVVFDDYDLIAMVDTQPEQGNHSLPAAHFPDVVIDHHPERPETRLAVVADVGRDTGATSTVVTDYLRASGLEMPPAIATALFYGIKSDTRDLERETTAARRRGLPLALPQGRHPGPLADRAAAPPRGLLPPLPHRGREGPRPRRRGDLRPRQGLLPRPGRRGGRPLPLHGRR